MSFSVELLLAAGTILVAIAGAWGDLRARLNRIEKMVGNGQPGVFIRRDEAQLILRQADHEHDEMRRRLDLLEEHGGKHR